MEAEAVREIVYETHFHASGPYAPNYPPQQVNRTDSFLSRAIKQVKERWRGRKHTGKQGKPVSLFLSERGENVAVVTGNYITLLRKDDDYHDPCGTFTSSSLNAVIYGAWSEAHDIFGFVDDSDNLYFIKTNGEEITKATKSDLKLTSPIVGLLSHASVNAPLSCMCCFGVVTSDGKLHCLEVSQDSSASVSLAHTPGNRPNSTKQFPENVFCHDFHPELSLLVVIGTTDFMNADKAGCCALSIWHKGNTSDLDLAVTCNIDGIYSSLKEQVGKQTYPKVLFSPSGKFVASLDVAGSLYLFKMDNDDSFFSISANNGTRDHVDQSIEGKKISSDVADFTWWSDHVVTIADRNGRISMIDILSSCEVMCNTRVCSLPVLERVRSLSGLVFILETTVGEEKSSPLCHRDDNDSHTTDLSVEDLSNQGPLAKMRWSLISFSERSITEMYNLLIGKQEYKAAVDLADRHGLDKDDVLKAQWLHSERKTNDVTMYLFKVKDQAFVLSECLHKVGATEDAERALLNRGIQITELYGFSEIQDQDNEQIWDFRIKRVQFLQFKDKLETYLGINMGRFSALEYKNFRSMLTHQAAITLAETGKIGALNLFFKRHPYSLASSMLEILSAIPETISVESYSQLLPGRSPPSIIALRDKDWVECERMASFLKKLPQNQETILQICTELLLRDLLGFVWPSVADLSEWYKNRARDIDRLSGQLENCLNLIDFGCCKGLHELQYFKEDISYLHQLIYCDSHDGKSVNLSIVEWEQLSDYQKFKLMLDGAIEENVVERLRGLAVPFMHSRCETWFCGDQPENESLCTNPETPESFLVQWLKEITAENKLDLCLMVLEEGCRDVKSKGFFRDENEAVDCALQCVYSCTALDSWNKMAAILSMLPQLQRGSLRTESLSKRLKVVEGHIEAGRLLAYYQVPKPISFFLDANSDGKNVKQLLRLILSKFSRRQPVRADDDWATMWRDMQTLQDKAFPFLDLEYMLIEFCRGLLKAGKFALARNYLKGTSTFALPFEKAENIVIQAAREYFFSASSLACSEIWKAKECLNLLPSSKSVKAEADVIDALTLRLPKLGVTILPVQFKQVKDPMEIIKLAITSQAGAYLHVDELIEIAKLLGLRSEDNISAIEDAIAREAAVAGDLQLAFDLCLILAKKGHGPVWDLCAAIARGPALDHMDINSRKQLLGFALSHCDEESIGELLHAWKDLDLQEQCDLLILSTKTSPGDSSHVSLPFQFSEQPELIERNANDVSNIRSVLSRVAESVPVEDGNSWESYLEENGKLVSFAGLQLPWLIDLSEKEHFGRKFDLGMFRGKHFVSARTQALVTIISWLARNNLAPKDSVVESLARSIFEPPVSPEDDIIGCSVLLNLIDAFTGVKVIEEQLKVRQDYQDISSIMMVGMTYSLLHSNGIECKDPAKRRELTMMLFKEKHTPFTSDEIDSIATVDSKFWREWKLKLEEQKRLADHSRVLEQVLPGVDVSRFLSGDIRYIEDAVFSFIESIKLEKKHTLKKLLFLARTYGLNHSKVLQSFVHHIFVSDAWTDEDITAEIADVMKDLIASAETIKTLSLLVYPSIDGCNKQRIAHVYSLLSDCCLQSKGAQDVLSAIFPDRDVSAVQLGHYYKLMEHECQRLAVIEKLNFKNIAGLCGLNLDYLRDEVYSHVSESNLEYLAMMVDNLGGLYSGKRPECIPAYQDIYKYHILKILVTLENQALTNLDFGDHEKFIAFVSQLEQAYDASKPHVIVLACSDALEIMKRYLAVIAPLEESLSKVSETSIWQECLVVLLNFWIRITDDMLEIASRDPLAQTLCFCSEGLTVSLKVFISLVLEDLVSPSEGWGTIVRYANCGLQNDFLFDIQIFCKAMILSGCGFGAVSEVYTRVMSTLQSLPVNDDGNADGVEDLPIVYSSILDTLLQDLNHGSGHQQDLFRIISSLCNLEGDLEILERARLTVWEKLARFSDNYQISGDVRVFILEVLQLISGSSVKGYTAKLQNQVPPWEGWNDENRLEETTTSEGIPAHPNKSDRFANNLVALRSSQMAASISPGIEISPDDLSTVDTAISCFMKLAEASSTRSHLDALIAIMEEWEGVFTSSKVESSAEASDPENNWGTNDWDEGWDFEEEEAPVESEKKDSATLAVHPLRVCWMEILKKLAALSCVRDIYKLVDKCSTKSHLIIDDNDAQSLISILAEMDCYAALKVALLLPYEELHVNCLDAVEGKLKQGAVSDALAHDQELLILILSSGVTSTIITKSQFGSTFSYLCYLVGNLSRRNELSFVSNRRKAETSKAAAAADSDDFLPLMNSILFPCFISELVKADQRVLAGFLVTKLMHTAEALSLINIADSSLRSYLERQLKALEDGKMAIGKDGGVFEILGNTISSLKDRSQNLIRTALSSINVRLETNPELF
uniref:Sec39 domain-containing protein n=1 Tax=Kalanchoe fedtschenkoi TaxID=63787 RepID=A0A7N0ZST8_KALFE